MTALSWSQDPDDPTLADRHEPGEPSTPTAHAPVGAPCPVCLKFVGHYEERHDTAELATRMGGVA